MFKEKRKRTSSEIICEIFNLATNQTIYQDYRCCYVGSITYFGRIYIGEEHFCFNSNMFGFNKQFEIKIDDITKMELEKDKIIGVVKKGEGEEGFVFSQFVNINFAYKLMHGLWKGERIEAKILGSNSQLNQGDLDEGSAMEVNFFNNDVSLKDKQTLTKIYFPCSVQQYYDFFLSDKASLLSCDKYLELKKSQNISVTQWVKSQQLNRQVRQIRALIGVTGVPLLSKARMHQIQTIQKSDNQINLSIVTQMSDVPYAAYFTFQQSQQIKYVDQKKCSLQVIAWLTFNKSTLMKKMIVDKSAKDIKQDYETWIKAVEQRLKSKVRKNSLSSPQNSQLQYQNAESSNIVDFTRILQQDFEQKEPKIVSVSNKNYLQTKINLIIGLLVFLIALNIHSYFR